MSNNLKAEIDEYLLEAYWGTVPLPFAADEHKRIPIKIMYGQGIESLKVLGVD